MLHRRGLNQSNPELCELLNDCIGDAHIKNGAVLSEFKEVENNETGLKPLDEIKAIIKQQLLELQL